MKIALIAENLASSRMGSVRNVGHKKMKIIKFNISKPKKYKNKAGNEKTQWNNIGSMTEFHKDDGKVSRIIEIPAINLEANIFPFTPKVKENEENQDGGYPAEGEDRL
mgnify:CR=1 FL=1